MMQLGDHRTSVCVNFKNMSAGLSSCKYFVAWNPINKSFPPYSPQTYGGNKQQRPWDNPQSCPNTHQSKEIILFYMQCQAWSLHQNNVCGPPAMCASPTACSIHQMPYHAYFFFGTDFTFDLGSCSIRRCVAVQFRFGILEFNWGYMTNLTSNSSHTSTKLTRRWLGWNQMCQSASVDHDL